MKSSDIEVEQMTREHLVEWFGEDGNIPTAKGWVAVHDGKLVGIAGLRWMRGIWVAFVDVKDELKERPHFLHRAVKKYLGQYQDRHKLIVAIQDVQEPTSRRWLEKLGFREDQKGVWKWLHSRQSQPSHPQS